MLSPVSMSCAGFRLPGRGELQQVAPSGTALLVSLWQSCCCTALLSSGLRASPKTVCFLGLRCNTVGAEAAVLVLLSAPDPGVHLGGFSFRSPSYVWIFCLLFWAPVDSIEHFLSVLQALLALIHHDRKDTTAVSVKLQGLHQAPCLGVLVSCTSI